MITNTVESGKNSFGFGKCAVGSEQKNKYLFVRDKLVL